MEGKKSKTGRIITVAAVLFAAVVCFFGRVSVEFGEESFTVKATFAGSDTISYESIESVRYLEHYDGGSRTLGVGSPVLNAGTFRSEEYGSYKRYTYTQCPACVEITAGGRIILISGKDEEATEMIYERLLLFAPKEK